MDTNNDDKYWIRAALEHYKRDVLYFDVDRISIQLTIEKMSQ